MPTYSRRRPRRRAAAYHMVRRAPARRASHRRRNSVTLPIHRGPMGVFVSDRGSSSRIQVIRRARKANPRRRRRNVMTFSHLTRSHGKYRSTARRAAPKRRAAPRRRKAAVTARKVTRRRRKKNPGHAVVRRRRRRSTRPHYARRHRRRRNPVVVYRKRRHARRRRNPDYGMALGVVGKSVSVLAGMSVSFGVPKLLGMYVHPAFQRGFGGVATSAVSSWGASWLVGKVNRGAGHMLLVGGIAGTILLGLSALSASARTMAFPIEEALLAASLPTMGAAPASAPALSAAAKTLYDQVIATGASPQVAMAAVQGAGLADYLKPKQLEDYYSPPAAGRRGPADYFKPNPSSKNSDYFNPTETF